MKNKKRGFTIAEMLVTIGIISFLAVILIPALEKTKPNQEHLMFRKAYYLITNIVSEIVNDPDLYPEPEDDENFYLSNTVEVNYHDETYGGNTKFCEIFSSKLNTIITPDCSEKVFVDKTTPEYQFKTTDNIAWILPISNFDDKEEKYPIYIDTNGEKAPNCTFHDEDEDFCKRPDRFTVYLKRNGKILIEGTKEKKYLESSDVSRG